VFGLLRGEGLTLLIVPGSGATAAEVGRRTGGGAINGILNKALKKEKNDWSILALSLLWSCYAEASKNKKKKTGRPS